MVNWSKRILLLIVGDYPPPYGGVSVQIAALPRLFTATPGFTCRVLDLGESRYQRRAECLSARNALDFVGKLIAHAARQYTIHLHTNGHNLKSWLVSLTCALAGVFNGRKTVLSIGSGQAPAFIRAGGWPTFVLIRVTLALMGAIICRNELSRSTIADLGIAPNKLTTLPGFYGVRAQRPPEIPEHVEDFLHRHSPIVAAMNYETNYLFNRAMKGLVPLQILSRRKQGFAVPPQYWLRNEPPTPFRENLLGSDYLGHRYFNRSSVEALSALYQRTGTPDYLHRLWILPIFELSYPAFSHTTQQP